ncbi:glycosyltransferase family 2 protein [Gordonibacter massiliensis]|nr:glycosyltransferase family 2 protein [Gordonibacter massiliensis (ex Traore et al. 2017)]
MNAENPSIAVAMSTYNGESHLEQQLDSVLGQDVGNLSVYVRDDGSQDGTLALLESYERQGSIHLLRGENVGVVASFLAAIAAVPCDVEFIALCDQDDEWHVDKLSRALSVLGQKDNSVPQLYCSEYRFCDADMNPTGRSHLNRIGVSFPTMLYENMVSGNTMVMNRALANRVNEAGREGVYCHDWWIALVATALGELTFDDFVSLEYRRTGSNASPTGSGGLSLLRYRLRTFFEKGELTNVARQLERLYRLYADEMPSERRALLERALTGGRLSKAFVPVRLRQKPIEEAALRLLLVLGRL